MYHFRRRVIAPRFISVDRIHLRNELSKDELLRLIKSISSMNALKHLGLKLDDLKVDDQVAKILAGQLLTFDFLKSLDLSLSGNPMTTNGVTNLLNEVSRLPRLQDFHCNLRRIKAILPHKNDISKLINSLRIVNTAIHL